MPRPTPHSFARQLGLQAIMWGLFIVALAGATQLSRTRDSRLRLAPMGPPQEFGWLKIRVPQGWIVQADPATLEVAALEPKHDGIQRLLIISQEQLSGPPDPEYLVRQLKHDVSVMPIQFAGLHVTGHLAQLTVRGESEGTISQEYFGVAVLPNNVALKVVLRGVPAFGPIDDKNFQQIVDSLQPATAPPSNRPPHRVSGPVDPIVDWHVGV
jgi:hypothetical protein